MVVTIKRFTSEDRKEYKEKHPGAALEGYEWAVLDGRLVHGFYATEEEAEEIKEGFVLDDKICDALEEAIAFIAGVLDVDVSRVRESIKLLY